MHSLNVVKRWGVHKLAPTTLCGLVILVSLTALALLQPELLSN